MSLMISGYELREHIKRWQLQRDTNSEQFSDSLYQFEGEQKTNPVEIMKRFEEADQAMARIEEIQQRFNQASKCNVQGTELTLAYCLKLVGGAGRREKMWRSAAVKKKDRWSSGPSLERNKDNEYAQRTVSQSDCLDAAKHASSFATALRAAIAQANSTKIDIESLGLGEEEAKKLFDL